MEHPLAAHLGFLRASGFESLEHDSHVPFLSHLIGTRRILVEWSAPESVCTAGLFHSVYGTEFFEHDSPPRRSEVRGVIGAEAEYLAWLWCTIERNTLEGDAGIARNRHTGEMIGLGAEAAAHLATLWAADTIEQIDRMAPDERAFAAGLGRVAHLASHRAQAALDERGLRDPAHSSRGVRRSEGSAR